MTDYTKATNFASKDDLPAGAAEKEIVGLEWDDELALISTAIASKYDTTDLSDQSTAEAGASNAVLLTPLRFAQHAAYRGLNRLAKDMDAWVVDGVSGAVLVAAESVLTDPTSWATTLISGVALAAGLNAVRFYLPATVTSGIFEEFYVSFQFSPTADAFAFGSARQAPSVPGSPTFYGNNTAALSRKLEFESAGTSMVEVVNGFVYMPSAGTMVIKAAYDSGGGRSQPTVGAGCYVAVRPLA